VPPSAEFDTKHEQDSADGDSSEPSSNVPIKIPIHHHFNDKGICTDEDEYGPGRTR